MSYSQQLDQIHNKDQSMFRYNGEFDIIYPQKESASMQILDCNQMSEDSYKMKFSLGEKQNEFFTEKPMNFKVKEAKKASIEACNYSICYKYNKASGRNLRYFVCEYKDLHSSAK